MGFKKTDDPVLSAIKKYKCYSSIFITKIKIKNESKIEPKCIFSFTPVEYKDILRNTKNLNVSKESQQSEIPLSIAIIFRVTTIYKFFFSVIFIISKWFKISWCCACR